MKTVTEQQKRDFREEQKYFTLTFSGGTVLTNDNIVLDSMRITRTLCDTEQISFSTVYASEFSIQIFNDGRRYEGQTVTVSLTAGTYTTDLGTYTVVSNPRSSDRLYRTLTAYDSIAAVLSRNYADWHNGLSTNPPTTIGAYRTAFFNHIGITQESATLCNDATAFTYAETSGTLSGATILGELCSINGSFGYLDFDQTFRWVTPYIDTSSVVYPSLTLYPSTTLYPMDAETAIENSGVDVCNVGTDSYDLGGLACEEFITENITQVYMHQGDVIYASGSEGNRLTISNTLFTMSPEVATQAVANIKAAVKDFNYTPTSVTMLATPWLELCDVVLAEVSATEKVYFPVLNFVLTGTGAIRQTIEAKGVRVNTDEATSTDQKIITASNSADYAAELARQAQQAADNAQQAADDAQDAADTAQETIDNYISANEIIVGTQTSTTGSWTGVAGFDELEDGREIAYWLPYGGSGNATLNLTLSGGGTTGAIPVYYRGTTRVTTHYAAGSILHLTYRVNANVAGTNYTGWWVDASFDSGDSKLRLEQAVKAKTAISASRFIVGDSAGYFAIAAGVTFDITKPILWASSAISANATGTSNFLAINGCTLRNNLPNITLTQYQTCYLVGTLNGKDFQVRTGNFFTSTVPTTDDGYYYISLGYLYSTYQIYLYPEHPIYKFVDGSFKSLEQVAYEATVFAGEAQTTANAAQQVADDAQLTADEALDTVNNIDIGGRNLLRGTNQYTLSSTRSWDDAEWGIGSGGDGTALVSDITNDSPVAGVTKSFSILNNTTGNRDIGQTQVPTNVGDEYTISGYVRLTNGCTSATMLVRYYTTGGAQIQLSKEITNTDWEYFDVTGTVNELGGSNACQFGLAGAGSIEYCAVQMEDGNMPTSWSPAPEDVDDAIDELYDELSAYIEGTELIVGTQTAETASWTGVAGFEYLEDGQQITYWLPYAGVANTNVTLNLTLKGGDTTGAIPVYYRGSSRVTTHFPAGTTIRMTYMMNASVAGTSYTGWWCDASYDSGNTFNRIRFENAVYAKSLIDTNRLIVGDSTGYFPLTASTPFDVTKPILYALSKIEAANTGTNNYIAINSATLRNNASGITLTQYATCYIVGTLAGNTFTPKAAPFFTSTIPTTNDGYYYISLGYLANTYQIYLYPEHPIYKFVDGSFKSLNQVAYEASVTASDAQDAADEAQQTADDAQTAADNAQQSADDAQTAADNAQTSADNAQQSADDALAAAEEAEQKAKEAMATFGNCSTAADTATKAVTCDNFPFVEGATIKVYFATASNVAVPTLNVNNTGAKAIYVKGQALNATTNPLMWAARTYITFIYDGTRFNVLDTPGTYTITCQTADATHAKVTGTMYNAIIMTGTTVNVFFTTAYTTSGALTLKVDSTTARTVFFGDVAVSATNPFTWGAGSTVAFALQGGYWYIVDSGATDKATDAGKVATNYLYMSTAKGLVISRTPVVNDTGVNSLTSPNSRVVSDGFDVYKNGTTRVAHFGATTDIGETGNSHLTIDSTSMRFKNANSEDNLAIQNGLTGMSGKDEYLVYVDPDNKSYRNTDGSLNKTVLASLIANMVEAHTMTSTAGDYVPNTTGVEFHVEIEGFVEKDGVTSAPSPAMSLDINWGGQKTLSNGVLTLTPAEATAADVADYVDEWSDNFVAGSTIYTVWLNYKLTYPVLGVAMTVGSRKANTDIGMGSLSVGRNNEASGTGSVALGKDLTMTSDYGVAIGEGNNVGLFGGAPVALDVGAGGRTAFAVLKTGNIIMSSVNSGRYNDVKVTAGTKSELTVTFEHPYPSVPFVFLTLCEDNIPDNRVTDYSAIQIFLKSVSNDQFSVYMLNGSSRDHTFGFNWFAICAM